MSNFSKRVLNISAAPIDIISREVTKLRQAGLKVFNLGQAICSLPLPRNLLTQLANYLTPEIINSYTLDQGMKALRVKIAEKYLKRYKVEINPEEEIMITAGANQAFTEVLIALADPKDEIILCSPYYFDHEFAVKAAGCIPVISALQENKQGFSLNLDDISAKITRKTKAVVIVTPNNPTGAVLAFKDPKALQNIIKTKNIWLISDETYDEFVFSPIKPYTALQLDDKERIVVISTFSKSFGLAGMRVGYIIARNKLQKELLKIQDAMIVCAPHLSQVAALLGFEAEAGYMKKRLCALEQRKNLVTEHLNKIKALEFRPIEGAFFAFPKYKLKMPSLDLALDILKKAQVAVIHGSAFGAAGEGHIRISFGNTGDEDLEEALYRLEKYFGK